MSGESKPLKASTRPPYAGKLPGTSEWMEVWKGYPAWQNEMLSYQALLQMGVNPIEPIEGFRVSNSALETTACSVKALLKYGYQVMTTEKVFALLVGVAVHKALAEYFKTGDPNKAYGKLLEVWPEGRAPEARLELDNVKVIMHHYLHETLKAYPYYVHPAFVELWFEQELYKGDEKGNDTEPIILVGRIDLVPEDPQSKVLMVDDHKTTGKVSDWWVKKWRLSSGLIGYLWAASRFMPGRLFPGCVVSAVELPKLSDPGRKCSKHKVDYAECRKFHPQHQIFQVPCEQHMMREWELSAVFQAKRLRQLIRDYGPQHGSYEGVKYVRMLGLFNGMCTFCEFSEFCAAGRPVEWIGSVLVKREDVMGMEG